MLVVDLPGHIVSRIASCLTVNDLLNFRSCCKTFYDASFSREVAEYLNIHIQPQASKLSSLDIFALESLLEKRNFGSYISLQLQYIQDIGVFHCSLDNITTLSIDLFNIKVISRKCPLITNLEICNEFCMKYVYDTFWESCKDEIIVNLQHLKKLKKLRTISVNGSGAVVGPTFILNLLKATPFLTSLSLYSIDISYFDAMEIVSETQSAVFSADHILDWCILEVNVDMDMVLPLSIEEFDCGDSYTGDTFFIDERHQNLKKVTLFSCEPNWNDVIFLSKVSHLELSSLNLMKYRVSCENLTKLELVDCQFSKTYLYSIFKVCSSSLSKLYIAEHDDLHCGDIYNDDLVEIIDNFKVLVHLELHYMQNITMDVVKMIKSKSLNSLRFLGCKKILVPNATKYVKELRPLLPFEVLFRED